MNVEESNPAIVAIDHRETETLIKASGCAWTFLRDAHYADAMILNAGPGFIASGVWLSSTKGGREAMVWREDCVDCAVAVTGVAGPGGGTAEKPVGLVHFGGARHGKATIAEHHVFDGDRAAVRRATVVNALGIFLRLAG